MSQHKVIHAFCNELVKATGLFGRKTNCLMLLVVSV